MYKLVNDVEAYPRFLPWCRSAAVERVNTHELVACIEINRAGLHRQFATRNLLEPPRVIHMQLESGPFRTLEGAWNFQPLNRMGSRVSLDLVFAFSSRLLDAVFAPIFSEAMNSLVDAFVAEARKTHGHGQSA